MLTNDAPDCTPLLPPSNSVDDVIKTPITADVAATPAIGSCVRSWFIAVLGKASAAYRARQLALIDRINRSGLAHID